MVIGPWHPSPYRRLLHRVYGYQLKEYNSESADETYPDSKVHGAHMGPIWGQQDPGGPHVGPMNFAI